MSNPWFRLYAEILHDHKVQMMTEAYRWRLVALMCLRCNVAETLPDSAIAFQLRLTEKEWQATKKVFIDNKFIDLDGNLINWDKRQFISDSSTERSRKHREKIAMQRCRDVSATPPDTDTDTDTDTDQKKIKKSFPTQQQGNEKILEVFEHWKAVLNHSAAKLDDKRKKAVTNALKLGYTVENLKAAIDGCASDPWFMGANPSNKRYDALTLILRNADNIDKFIALSERASTAAPECPCEEIFDLYEEILIEAPKTDPRFNRAIGLPVNARNAERQQMLIARWQESGAHQDLNFWTALFELLRDNPFYNGTTKNPNYKTPFQPSIEFILGKKFNQLVDQLPREEN